MVGLAQGKVVVVDGVLRRRRRGGGLVKDRSRARILRRGLWKRGKAGVHWGVLAAICPAKDLGLGIASEVLTVP